MSDNFLDKIIAEKKGLLKNRKVFFAQFEKNLKKEKLNRYKIFKQVISKPGEIHLIAEIKKASPSVGLIRENFDLLSLAKVYADSGAAALSILTEEKYFLGKPAYIRTVSDKFNLPILAKDFIIDEVQIFEAFYNGASAILLIVAILTDARLKKLMTAAAQLDMDCLVEVHDEKELARALKAKAEIIGINNRNLKTLDVNLDVCRRLIPKIPKGKVIVAESGLKTHQEIMTLKELGAHAVLIGEVFMKATDMGKKIREVIHGEKENNDSS